MHGSPPRAERARRDVDRTGRALPPLTMAADWEILKAFLEFANENMFLDCVDKRAYQDLEKTRVGQTLLSHIESMEGLRRMGGQPLARSR